MDKKLTRLQMTSKTRSILGLLSVLALAMSCIPASAAGPTSRLYLTGGEKVFVVQGASMLDSFDHASGPEAYPIAVADTVRTAGTDINDALGAEYSLAGAFTGTTFAGLGTTAFDATTDRAFNYYVEFDTGNVYRTGLDWSNPELLFDAGDQTYLGITYDRTDNTLWLAQYSSGVIEQRSMTGAVLASFSASVGGGLATALALDPADQTLWIANQLTATLYQYSKAGDFLGFQQYAALDGLSILGGEFAMPVPEPSACALLLAGLALVGLTAKRRMSSPG